MRPPTGASPHVRHLLDRIESEQQLETLMSMVSGVQPEFGRSLQRVADWGLAAVPAADGVGVAVLQEGKLDHLAATAPFVADIDDAQYGTMQGPCVTAATENRTVIAASMIEEDRWPDLGAEIAPIGVHSALSIPLTVSQQVIGTLNIYARQRDAFDAAAAARAEQYAEPAAAALQKACVARRARLLTDRLGAAVERRRIINRTVGLLMAQDGIEADEARAMLEATSGARGQQLETVARAIWDERIPFACLPPSDDALRALRR
jgi:transcriptional regulator with GAF, ATPase, and Fis domain